MDVLYFQARFIFVVFSLKMGYMEKFLSGVLLEQNINVIILQYFSFVQTKWICWEFTILLFCPAGPILRIALTRD